MSKEPSSPFIEPLRDAFAAFALESTSSPTSLPPNGSKGQPSDQNAPLTRKLRPEGRHETNAELRDMQSQLNPTLPQRPITLSDLWADPNSSQTMSLLHSQFVNELDRDPSQLTVQDYVKLFRQNFRDLNDEIEKEGLLFVEYVQEYELLEQQEEELKRRLRQEQEEQVHQLNSQTALPHREMHEVPYHNSLYSSSISAFIDVETRSSRDRSQRGQRLSPLHLPGCPQAMADLRLPCQLCGAGMEHINFNNYLPVPLPSGSHGRLEGRPNINVPSHPTISLSQPHQHQHQHNLHESRDYRAPRRVHSFHESQ